MSKTFDTTPSAAILIESLRDIGYSLETALADVIDNSITAHASRIELFASSESPFRIGIVDNGEGMTLAELQTAMTPGSRSPKEKRAKQDLGRFGLGLKTASFSQCRRFTVVSRKLGETNAATWDMGFVAEMDAWLVQVPEDIDSLPWMSRLEASGTLVIWEDLDRVIEVDTAEKAASHFAKRLNGVCRHLELVFHRFLSGEAGLKKVAISLNNRLLEAHDPFNSRHPATILSPVETIKLGDDTVRVQSFTLPHHRKLKLDEWERNAGPGGYLKNQGFYVYRERRLILFGTWFGMAKQAELTKLARVKIDIPNGLDAEWKIDVKKASAQPPMQVRKRLKGILENIGATSKRVYTRRGRRLTTDNRLPVWNRHVNKNEITYMVNREHPVVSEFMAALPDNMADRLDRVLELAESAIPLDMVFADMGGLPDQVKNQSMSESALKHAVVTVFAKLAANGVAPAEIEEMLREVDPFKSNWKRAQLVIQIVKEEQANDKE